MGSRRGTLPDRCSDADPPHPLLHDPRAKCLLPVLQLPLVARCSALRNAGMVLRCLYTNEAPTHPHERRPSTPILDLRYSVPLPT